MNIKVVDLNNQTALIAIANGLEHDNTVVFPLKNGAYRIVPDNNYIENLWSGDIKYENCVASVVKGIKK